MIVTGNWERVCERVREYADKNLITGFEYEQLLGYVKQHHRIGKSGLYNLNNIKVTCRVWECRRIEGK